MMIEQLRDRFKGLPRFRDAVSVTRGLEHFNDNNQKAILTSATLPRGARSGKRYARFARSSSIDSYAVDWHDCYVDSDLFSRERKEQFSRPKLIFAGQVPRLRVACDESGLALGDSLFSVAFKQTLSIPYLAGLLNSSLLNLLLNLENGLLPNQKPKRLEARYLSELPVLLPDRDSSRKLQRYIEGNVQSLIHALQARSALLNCWREAVQGQGLRYEPLERLLANHLTGQKNPWVKHLAPSLATLMRRSRKFKLVQLRGDLALPVLRIYGLTETGDEMMIAEAEFAGREPMLYVCCAWAGERTQRRMSGTMGKLLRDTKLPVIGDDPDAAARTTLARTFALARKQLAREKIPCSDLDIVRIEDEAERLGALTDAEVFRLYDLSWDDSQAVMSRLTATSRECQQVATYYERVAPDRQEPAKLL